MLLIVRRSLAAVLSPLLVVVAASVVVPEAASAAAACSRSAATSGYAWTSAATVSTRTGFCVQDSQGDKLTFQTDGNLVLYRASGRPQWSSGTAGRGQSVSMSRALVTVRGCDSSGANACPAATLWSSNDQVSGSHRFTSFMIQVGHVRSGSPCWLVAAYDATARQWDWGTIRGDTSGTCGGTVAADS